MYGALVWGVLPVEPGASWETHLAGALIGIACALAYRRRDVPPRVRYSWEIETPVDEQPASEFAAPSGIPHANGSLRPLPAPDATESRDWLR